MWTPHSPTVLSVFISLRGPTHTHLGGAHAKLHEGLRGLNYKLPRHAILASNTLPCPPRAHSYFLYPVTPLQLTTVLFRFVSWRRCRFSRAFCSNTVSCFDAEYLVRFPVGGVLHYRALHGDLHGLPWSSMSLRGAP